MSGGRHGRAIPAAHGRVAVVDDDPLRRIGIRTLLTRTLGVVVVRECADLSDLGTWVLAAPPRRRPHLIVVGSGTAANAHTVQRTIRALQRVGVSVLALDDDPSSDAVAALIRAGARGVVDSRGPVGDLPGAARAVLSGRTWLPTDAISRTRSTRLRPKLSSQESRALSLYASGWTIAAVAEELGVGCETARTYIRRVKLKYADAGRLVHSKIDLNRVAREDGWLAE